MENRQIKFGIIMTITMGIITMLTNLILTAVLARCINQVEYGIYLLLGSIVAYISAFDFGLNNTISRYIAKFRAERDKLKESSLISITTMFYLFIAVLILVVGFVIRANLSYFVKDVTPKDMTLAKNMMLLLVINIAITMPLNSFAAILVGYEKFIYTRAVSIVRILIVPILSIPLLYLGKGSMAVVIITTVSNVLAGAANLFYVIKKIKIKFKIFYWQTNFIKEIVSYSLFIFLGVAADYFIWNTGNIVIGMTNNPALISVYGVAIQLCNYFVAIIAAMTGLFLPRTTVLVYSGAEDGVITDYLLKVSRMLSILICLIIGGFFAIGRSFIYFWLGNSYSQVYLLAVLIFIPNALLMTKAIALSILQAKSMHAFRSVLMLLIGVLNLIVSYFLAKYIGTVAVAVSLAVSLLMINFIMDFYYHYKVKISILRFYKSLIRIFAAMVAAFLIANFTFSFGDFSLIIMFAKGGLFTASFFVILWWFALNNSEKALVKNVMNRLPKRNHINGR